MARTGKGRVIFWLVVAAAGALLARHFFGAKTEVIDDGARDGSITVTVSAASASEATITVDLRDQGSNSLTVAIPAGTVLKNEDREGQWLMTAHATTVHVTRAAPMAQIVVATYCLNQFQTAPSVDSKLSLGSDLELRLRPGATSEETEPVQQLAACLDKKGADLGDGQLAMWMVSDGWSGMSYSSAKAGLIRKYVQEGEAQRSTLEQKMSMKLKQDFPRESEEQRQAEIDYYLTNTLETALRREAEQYATQQLEKFIRVGGPLLEQCGKSQSDIPLLASAR